MPISAEAVSSATVSLRAAGCVFAEDEAAVLVAAAADAAALRALVARRAAGEPLEQVVGHADFCGVRVRLRPGVFVPRVRSDLLVRLAARQAAPGRHRGEQRRQAARRTSATPPSATPANATPPSATPANATPPSATPANATPPSATPANATPPSATPANATSPSATPAGDERPVVVVDLCCGSGALALALLRQVPTAEVHAADVDPVAVACARDNLGDRVYQGDLFDALPATLRGRIDVLIANVPYVATDHLPLLPAEARLHEPRTALDGGGDGLDVFRAVVAGAPRWLAPGGVLLSEITAAQVAAATAAVRSVGLQSTVTEDEDLDARVVQGRRALR
ncbi:methyltransferase [Jidongwangia harbinensis]|uniref:methyltransferase n=1 Tax=Jidongwangia harbinensis TaxID=2878561 RepID=UPI001CD99952|nr:methyltransferase [Jidongwangia harbinensis]MCA2217876.1 methyltransferase [Jidongwangia harbinensis]